MGAIALGKVADRTCGFIETAIVKLQDTGLLLPQDLLLLPPSGCTHQQSEDEGAWSKWSAAVGYLCTEQPGGRWRVNINLESYWGISSTPWRLHNYRTCIRGKKKTQTAESWTKGRILKFAFEAIIFPSPLLFLPLILFHCPRWACSWPEVGFSWSFKLQNKLALSLELSLPSKRKL